MSQAREALHSAYTDLAGVVAALDEQASWRPTACAGWAVRDLVFHLLGDAQRALVALGTPARGPADLDAVTYWTDASGREDPESRGVRATRTMASAWRLELLTATYVETSSAVMTLAGTVAPDAPLATQGHVLLADDLLATLAVETAIHHLDLVVDLDRPGPGPAQLALTRSTLDGLLGHAAPVAWDDQTWARIATGRRALTDDERAAMGADAELLPLLH